jgi:hypothetical protein
MLIGLFVTCIVLTLSPHGGKAEKGAPARAGARIPAKQATLPEPAERSSELYSLRARRRFAAYLRMRLLEMREAGLERAADAVERRLPVDALVP